MKAATSISFDTDVLRLAQKRYGRGLSSHLNELLKHDLDVKEDPSGLSEVEDKLSAAQAQITSLELRKSELQAKAKKEAEESKDKYYTDEEAYNLSNEGGVPYHIAFPDKK